jgi:hypothetical protein
MFPCNKVFSSSIIMSSIEKELREGVEKRYSKVMNSRKGVEMSLIVRALVDLKARQGGDRQSRASGNFLVFRLISQCISKSICTYL